MLGMVSEQNHPASSGRRAGHRAHNARAVRECATMVRRLELEKAGYQVIGFSAVGICDRAMEEMIGQGFFEGVVDLGAGRSRRTSFRLHAGRGPEAYGSRRQDGNSADHIDLAG